jgi:hypothetical protein
MTRMQLSFYNGFLGLSRPLKKLTGRITTFFDENKLYRRITQLILLSIEHCHCKLILPKKLTYLHTYMD